MTDLPSAEDVIFGGGGYPSAKWPQVGAWVGGPIMSTPKTYHAKEYVPNNPNGGRPLYKQSGEPVIGVRVNVRTSQRDPSVSGDDGTRTMHLDKWRQQEALREALNSVGVRKLETGGELWVQWTGEETDGSGQSPKTWTAKYRPPAGGVEVPNNTPDGYSQPVALPSGYQPPPAAAFQTSAHQPGYGTPGPAPAWAQGPQDAQQAPVAAPAPAGPPAAPQGPVQGQVQPGAGYSVPPVTPQPAAAPGPTNVITESVAAALRVSGVDVSGFTIVPG